MNFETKFCICCFIVSFFMLLFTNVAYADNYPFPEDSVIKVYSKEGKLISEFNADQYRVVKANRYSKLPIVKVTQIIYKEQQLRKNRFTYKMGVNKEHNEGIVGFSYSRNLTSRASLGTTLLNNNTYTFDVGFDF